MRGASATRETLMAPALLTPEALAQVGRQDAVRRGLVTAHDIAKFCSGRHWNSGEKAPIGKGLATGLRANVNWN